MQCWKIACSCRRYFLQWILFGGRFGLVFALMYLTVLKSEPGNNAVQAFMKDSYYTVRGGFTNSVCVFFFFLGGENDDRIWRYDMMFFKWLGKYQQTIVEDFLDVEQISAVSIKLVRLESDRSEDFFRLHHRIHVWYTYIQHTNHPHVGKYAIRGSYRY